MNHIKTFTQLLRIRALFQRVKQLSWTLQKLEYKFQDLEKLSPTEQQDLLEAYWSFMGDFMNIYEELSNERQQSK